MVLKLCGDSGRASERHWGEFLRVLARLAKGARQHPQAIERRRPGNQKAPGQDAYFEGANISAILPQRVHKKKRHIYLVAYLGRLRAGWEL